MAQFRVKDSEGVPVLTVTRDGNVGIGLGDQLPDTRLQVNGTIRTDILQISEGASAGLLPVVLDGQGNIGWTTIENSHTHSVLSAGAGIQFDDYDGSVPRSISVDLSYVQDWVSEGQIDLSLDWTTLGSLTLPSGGAWFVYGQAAFSVTKAYTTGGAGVEFQIYNGTADTPLVYGAGSTAWDEIQTVEHTTSLSTLCVLTDSPTVLYLRGRMVSYGSSGSMTAFIKGMNYSQDNIPKSGFYAVQIKSF
jgi:hypothetical protein